MFKIANLLKLVRFLKETAQSQLLL